MKKLVAISALALLQTSLFAATGEVTLSGSTWTGKVDGTTKYTGTSLAGAASACATAMTSGGTINIRNSGTCNGTIRIYANTTVNGNGCTLTGNGTTGIVKAQNVSSVGAQNINMAGSDYFGMYFSTCNGQSFSGVNGTSGIAYRIDDCKGGLGYSFSCGSPTLTSGGDNGVETYGISGVSLSKVTATEPRRLRCALELFKQLPQADGHGEQVRFGGGYAGFRCANNNRSSTLTYDNATSCGRGFFSVSGSGTADSDPGQRHQLQQPSACWLQSTFNTEVSGGQSRAASQLLVDQPGSGRQYRHGHLSVSH